MADTFTAVLSLTKPEVGASLDTWGTKLNDNFDDVDGLFQAGPALKVANGGTAATTASGARTNLGLGTMATQAADAVAITGGGATLGSLVISATTPATYFYESGAGTDEKYWRWLSTGGDLYLSTADDALSTAPANPILISRTGTTVDSIALTATAVTINGNTAYHAGNAPIASGTFTVYLRATNNGSDLASGTATWKKHNGVVTVTFPALTTTNTTTTLVLDGLPADIQSAYGATQDFIVRGLNDAGLTLLAVRVFSGTDYFSLTLYDGTSFASSAASKGFNTPFTLTYIV